MKQILMMSDSHGLTEEINTIKRRHLIEKIVHCGDSELTVHHDELKDMLVVKGNCDYEQAFHNEIVFEDGGLRFLVTHGHLYDVRPNVHKLSLRAQEQSADVVLYGHTHTVHAEEIDQQLFINPGSIKQPRGYPDKTYAILSWADKKNIHLTFYKLDGSVIEVLNTTVSLSD